MEFNMTQTSLKNRLVVGLSLLLFFFVLQAIATWRFVEQTQEQLTQATTRQATFASELGDLSIFVQQMSRSEKEYFVTIGNPEQRSVFQKEWTDSFGRLTKKLQKLKANPNWIFAPEDIKKIVTWQGAADFYGAEMRNVFSAAQTQANLVAEQTKALEAAPKPQPKAKGKAVPAEPAAPLQALLSPTQANDMIKAGKDRLSNDLMKGVDAMIKAKVASATTLADEAQPTFDTLLFSLLATTLIGIVIALGLMFYCLAAMSTLTHRSSNLDPASAMPRQPDI
jgi:CHASE3 domain sensor protein